MIQVFRVLSCLVGVYTLYLTVSGFSAGMVPIWSGFFIIFLTLSLKPSYEFLMKFVWFKGIMIIGVLVFTILLGIILHAGNKNQLDTEADVLIVLGAKVNPEGMSLTLRRRADKAYAFLIKHQDALAVLSGGQGQDEPMSEGLAMYEYLIEKGIDKERLFVEDQSVNTEENIRFSYELLESEGVYDRMEELKFLIVSSRFHIFRATMIAKQNNYEMSGLGCSTLQILEPNYYLREVFAVIYQFSKNFL